jgi:hypothetical protein
MLTWEAYGRIMKLLPKLSALTDKHRLKVLSDIDRVLAAAGLTWADFAAEAVPPPEEDVPVDVLLTIVESIELEANEKSMFISTSAREFLMDLRGRARSARGDRMVHLSGARRTI